MKLFIFLFSCLLTCFVSNTLSANSCKSPTVREAFEKAEVVFVGRMISSATEKISQNYKKEKFIPHINATRYLQSDGTVTEVYYRKVYNFQPIKSWKGAVDNSHKIYRTAKNIDTEYFKTGQNYLIFSASIPHACAVSNVGTEMGYTITLLLDQLASKASESLGKRTPDNTYIGSGSGVPKEELTKRRKEELKERIRGAYEMHGLKYPSLHEESDNDL